MPSSHSSFTEQMRTPWMKTYVIGLVVCLLAYAGLLVLSLELLKTGSLGFWRAPVGLMPAVPMAVLVLIYMRSLRQMDEFTRHIHVRSVLFAAAVTTIASFFIAFFGNAGIPRLTFHVWPLMCGSWGVALCYNTRKFR